MMDFAKIQQLWAQQPTPPQLDDEARIRKAMGMAARLRRRARTRDYVELGTAAGLAALFGWIATLTPVPWPWAAAAVVTLGVGLVFVRERARVTGELAEPTSVRGGLERSIAEVDHQIHLLGSVAIWYLAPLGVVGVLVLVGTLLGVKAEVGPEVWARGRAGFIGASAAGAAMMTGLFWAVWWLNTRPAARHLMPHRAALVASLARLDAEASEEAVSAGRAPRSED